MTQRPTLVPTAPYTARRAYALPSPRCIVFAACLAFWACVGLAACQTSQPSGKDLWMAVCVEQGTC